MSSRFLFAVAAVLVLVPASAADATVTTSAITTPADGTNLGVIPYTGGIYPFTVSGTSNGSPGELVDLYCLGRNKDGAQTGAPVQADVPLGAGGSIATSSANANAVGSGPCRLLALPDGADPAVAGLAQFTGPDVGASLDSRATQSGGPNAGKEYYYYATSSMSRGYMGFDPASSCGLDDGKVFGPDTVGLRQVSQFAFICEGQLSADSRPTPTTHRSGVQVDGINAYLSSAARDFGADQPWNGLTHTVTYDAAAGATTIVEQDALVRCQADDQTQAPSSTCTTLNSLGVALKRTIVVDHQGRVASIAETWSSQTQRALDLLEENDWHATAGFRLPGESAFSAHTAYEHVAVADPGKPASLLTIDDRSSAPGFANPVASISFSKTPDQLIFPDNTLFYAHWGLSIPAGGSVTLTRIYAQETSSTALAALTSEAEDRAGAPSVAISAPADGATVSDPNVLVTGSASDNVGVASVTVDGQPVALSSGTFTKAITLAEGANTISVVATDATGTTGTASRRVTYTKPAAPGGGGGVPPGGGGTPPPPALPEIGADGVVRCPAGGAACTATGTWTSRQAFAAAKKKHRVVLARWSSTVQPGKSARARPRLTPAGGRLLHRRSVAATRSLTARAGTGRPATSSRKVTLKRIRHKKH